MITRICKRIAEVIRDEYQWYKVRCRMKNNAVRWSR